MSEENKCICEREGCDHQARLCYFHQSKKRDIAEWWGATSAIVMGIVLLCFILYGLIVGVHESFTSSRIDISVLDDLCVDLYGENHVYAGDKIEVSDITCAVTLEKTRSGVINGFAFS